MLHHITEDGHLHWKCHNKDCPPLTAHISHEQIQYTELDNTVVALPACECGARTFVKVDFAERDLLPPIIHTDSRGRIVQVEIPGAPNFTKIIDPYERDASGRQVRVIDRVEQHPAIARHQELKRQLEAIGKKPN